jgi:hypothetical protein
VPGKPVNDQQARLYMRERQNHTQRIAAARAGIGERTARRLEADPRLPSQRRPARGRTVPDPLAGIWEDELEPMLERDPAIRAVTMMRYLRQHHPERFPTDGVRRTLERRVRDWRALRGPDREVIFRQAHAPGRMALSDFTDAGALGVTVAGEALPHRLYHFVLAYSGWEHAAIVLGGESFTALAENLQDALWALGAVPAEHRTDSLSAAFRNLTRDEADDVTRRYRELCGHYGVTPSRNNPGEAHENGAVEAHHGHLKDALGQALILRGSRDFDSLDSYRGFLDSLVARRNMHRRDRLQAELPSLRPLPPRRTTDFVEIVAQVTRTGGFQACGVFYSAPSRLIGHRLRVHLYDDRIEAFLGHTRVVTHPRGRSSRGRRVHVVDYRHVVHALKRKPMALAGSVYRDSLFPHQAYRQAWDALDRALPRRQACRRMVALLALAHEEACEAELADLLAGELAAGRLPDPQQIARRIAPRTRALPDDVPVALTPLASYDSLLEARR